MPVKVTTTTETITPKLAEQWLEKNKDNRPVRDHHVRMLAREMREGLWQLNGEAIVFDFNGNLLDGQHRLWAAYEHEQSFDSVVVRGVAPDAFVTIDSGMKRSAGDVLGKAGMAYGTLTAATLRLVHFYETGRKDHAVVQRMSNAETLAVAGLYPRIAEAIALVGPSQALKTICSQAALAATAYFALEVDDERTKQFLDAIATGADLRKNDPRLRFRGTMINAKARGRAGGIHYRVVFAMLIKTWNAFAEGSEMPAAPRYPEGETFPEFKHRTGQRPVRRTGGDSRRTATESRA